MAAGGIKSQAFYGIYFNMFWIVVTLFFIIPWLEFWLMMQLGFSLTFAILLGVVTAGAGWWYSRGEGLTLLTELESDVQNGIVPTEEGLDAILTVIGGWALILPGLLTDMAGAALMFPPVRNQCVSYLRKFIRRYLLNRGKL